MKQRECVLVTGGTGLIGSNLLPMLRDSGYEVLVLSRKEKRDSNTYHWDIQEEVIEREALARADHVIHLAGAGLADERWTKKRKQEIIDSRVDGANLIYECVKRWGIELKSFITASAIGYYGPRGDEWITEENEPGNDFLSEVCEKWEQAATQFEELNIRAAQMRIGIVLSTEGGMLKETLRPLNFGLAPYFGDGSHVYSWVHIEDVCRAYLHVVENSNLSGPYNVTAEHPVSNKELVKTLKTVKGKSALTFGAPAFGLRIAFGEMADAILNGSKISSEKLRKNGFEFKFSKLSQALQDLLKK